VKTLLHADMYRESGGEEGRKEQQRAKRMQRHTGSGQNKPQPRPTNKTGRQALGNNAPGTSTSHFS